MGAPAPTACAASAAAPPPIIVPITSPPTMAWLPVDISAETSWNSSAGWLAETSWIWSPWTSGSRSTFAPFRNVPKREFVSEST